MKRWSIACCLLLVAVAGCAEEKKQRLWRHDDDDDDRHTTSASASASAKRSLLDVFNDDDDADDAPSAAGDEDASPSPSGRPPRSPGRKIDPEVEKRYRLEACLATARIVEVARDHYLDSLKTAPPSPSAIPKFVGSFSSRAHACRSASGSRSAKVAAVDEALALVSADAGALSRALVDAEKYYKNEKQKTDSFAEGRALHKTIVGVSDARTSREALERAFDIWAGTLAPPDTASWSKARLAARDYLATARTVSRLLEATPIAMGSIEKGALALEAQLKALDATDSDRSDRLFRSSAERFSTAVATLAKTKGTARPELVHALSQYIRVVDAGRMSFEGELSPRPPRGRPPLPPRP